MGRLFTRLLHTSRSSAMNASKQYDDDVDVDDDDEEKEEEKEDIHVFVVDDDDEWDIDN